ncbi:MAG: alpha/beta fold hydrolase [Eubacteriales bacterium]|nr:alpha/beta fold hydrolase [Eubacteriales bacterium]
MDYDFPSSDGILISGKRGRIFAHYYLPGGPYPKPVVVVCHGIPGNERLFDFSVFFREHGFCTVNFHYSGSWGSDGNYSVAHCFEDTGSVIEYVRRNENGWFDTDNIFVVGHSLGGLMAAYAISSLPEVKGGAILAPYNVLADSAPILSGTGKGYLSDLFSSDTEDFWLKGFKKEELIADIRREPERYDLVTYAKGLSEKPVFLATCMRDTVCIKEKHGGKLAGAIKECREDAPLVYREYDTDHCFNTLRNEVKKDITDHLLGNLL